MAITDRDLNVVINYAEKRADTSKGIDDCIIVYSYDKGDGIWYVADGVEVDDDSQSIMPEGATQITSYGMCSYYHTNADDEENVGEHTDYFVG